MQSISDEEIVFSASEDLYNESKTQIILYKNTAKSMMVTHSRMFQSYCYELCGRTGLSFKTIRFKISGRDVKLDTVISNSCLIGISHKAEFAIEPTNSLKSSLKHLILNGSYSDITLKINCNETKESELLNCHRCILASRSLTLAVLLDQAEGSEISIYLETSIKCACFLK